MRCEDLTWAGNTFAHKPDPAADDQISAFEKLDALAGLTD